MSAAYSNVHGFFCITAGVRCAFLKTKPNSLVAGPQAPGTVNYYMVYQTSIQCELGEYLTAEVRKYSPPGDIPLPNDTIVYLEARASISASGNGLLEAVVMEPVPGDVGDAGYDDSVPNVPFPLLVLLGVVTGTCEELGDGSRAFNIEVAAHVCRERRTSTVKCVYEGDSPRWRNVKAPAPRSMVLVLATCRHIAAEQTLAVRILDITFINSSGVAPILDTGAPMDGSPPAKRKRFNAIHPGPSPVSSPSVVRGSHPRDVAAAANSVSTPPVASGSRARATPVRLADRTPVDDPAEGLDGMGSHDTQIFPAEAIEGGPIADAPVIPAASRSRKGKGRAA